MSHKPDHSIGKLPEHFNAPTINFSMSNRVLFQVFKKLMQMVSYCNLAFSVNILKPFPVDICSSTSF